MRCVTNPLYHYTCEHGFAALGAGTASVEPLAEWNPRAARKIPRRFEVMARLSWFTDLDSPHPREALGLTSKTVECDRTTHRYRVLDETGVVPWISSRYRRGGRGRVAAKLESEPGALPRHWWVAPVAVAVVYDPVAAS